MEIVLALAIGVLTTCGVWLMLRPRTYQVIMGLALLGYGVNLFIFSMGRLSVDSEPIMVAGFPPTFEFYDDPMPQALVLTAIVIGFAMTALFLVVMLAQRGFAGNDHVDGEEKAREVGE
jgi:multicomponent K+:H+ antiporter subunit C